MADPTVSGDQKPVVFGIDYAVEGRDYSYSPEHGRIPGTPTADNPPIEEPSPAVVAAIDEFLYRTGEAEAKRIDEEFIADTEAMIESRKRFPDKPRSPAPPQVPNSVKVSPAAASRDQAKATAARHIKELPTPPDIQLVGINDTTLPVKEAPPPKREAITVEEKLAAIQERTGLDITKKLLHNPDTVRGSAGRKAARAQLKLARKEQLKQLKATGWLDQQKAEAAERLKPLSPGMQTYLSSNTDRDISPCPYTGDSQ